MAMTGQQDCWAVLDTETGGFARDGSICEIGVVWYDFDGNVVDQKEFRVSLLPGLSISPQATEVHGISETDLAGEPSLVEVMAELKPALQGIRIVAQNAHFDRAQLEAAVESDPNIWKPELEQWVDLLYISRWAYPDEQHHRLSDMLSLLGLPDSNFPKPKHNGLGDALREGAVLCEIVSQCESLADFHSAFKLYDERVGIIRKKRVQTGTEIGKPKFGTGTCNCLGRKYIVVTGVFPGLVRNTGELEKFLNSHGGCMQQNVTRTTDILIVNENIQKITRTRKMQKAYDYGITQVSHQEFLDMLCTY